MTVVPPVPKKKRGSLSGRVAVGALVMVAGKVLVRLIDLISLAIVARLLTPADYGVIALAMVFLVLLESISNLRLSMALVRKSSISDSEFATAFTLSMLRGLFAGGMLFAIAGPAGALLDEPLLTDILRILAVVPVLDGLINQRFVLFEKNIDFSKDMSRQVVAKFAGVVLTIILAIVWQNYWALVAGTIFNHVVLMALSYTFMPGWPRFGLAGWRDFVAFGGWLAGANAVATLNYRSDILILGSAFDQATVGQYNVGSRMATAFTSQLSFPVMRTVYSGLSSISDNKKRLRDAYRKAQASIIGIMLPLGVGAALLAHEAIIILVGPQWLQAVLVIQFVAPAMALSMLTSGVQSIVMVDGSTRRLFFRNVAALGIRIPAMLIGLWMGGFLGLLIGRVMSTVVLVFMNLKIASSILQDPIMQPILAAWRTLTACAVMVLAVVLVGGYLPVAPTALTAALFNAAVKGGVGACVYTLTLLALWFAAGRPDGFEQKMIDFVQRLRQRDRKRRRKNNVES